MTPADADLAALLTCRVALGTAEARSLRVVLRRTSPEPALRRLRRERLGPIAHDVLRDATLGEVPDALRTALAADYYAAGRHALISARSLERVLAALPAAGVAVLALKGMALAEPLYGNPALRPMEDIDILVPRPDVARARDVLQALGYEPPRSFEHDARHRAASLFLRGPGAGEPPGRLDLHWDLVDAKSGPRGGRWADGVWNRAETVGLGNRLMPVLAPADALLHACVHLTVNHGLLGLLWRLDIALMARVWSARLDWDRVVATAVDARLTGIVYAALCCTEATLGAAIPREALARLRPRAARARGLERWLLPRFAALGSIPYQDYVVPLLTLDRARDVAAVLFRRLSA